MPENNATEAKADVDERIPTYEESVESGRDTNNFAPAAKSPPTIPLASRLAYVRRARIETLVEDSILPLFEGYMQSGLSGAVFTLITSDEHTVADMPDTVLGTDQKYRQITKLAGYGNNSSFWQQPTLMRELEASLRARFGIAAVTTCAQSATGPGIASIRPPEQPTRHGRPSRSVSSSGKNKRSFWSSLVRMETPETPMFRQSEVSWKTEDDPELSETWLRARYEDVPIRSSTPMGTYWTRNCKAIVLEFHIQQ